MKNAILIEPHFLPNLQYLSKFLLHEQVIIDDLQRYQKQSYRNRALISGSNQILSLTIPLLKGKTKQPIHKVQIDHKQNWEREHWESIRSAYGKAPFFEYYEGVIRQHFEQSYDRLLTFDLDLLNTLLKLLQLPARYHLRSQYQGDLGNVEDWRCVIHPKKETPDPRFHQIPYTQVFEDRWGFIGNLSGMDLLFNEGPASKEILKQCIISEKP